MTGRRSQKGGTEDQHRKDESDEDQCKKPGND